MKKNGKYCNGKKSMNMKPLALLLALTLLVGCAIGGTIAWLTAKTDDVVNTFTVGDIAIKLEEHAYDPDDTDTKLNDEVVLENNYPMIPGTTYFKDPTVYVEANSEQCYLFVKVTETNNPADYLTYTYTMNLVEGWTKGTLENGLPQNVWYRIVDNSSTDQSWNLLTDNKVAIKTTVVKANTPDSALKNGEIQMPASDKQPKLEFTAYAVQSANLTVVQAWEQATAMENSGSGSTT